MPGGQVSDIAVAYELLEYVDVFGSIVMADKAYGAADFRIKIEKSGAAYVFRQNRIQSNHGM